MKLVKRIKLTSQEILSRISEYDMYRFYFGPFTPNIRIINRLRGDKTAGSFVITIRETMFHMDFADEYWRGNCFNLVQQIYKCSYSEALAIIDRDFGLGISDRSIKKDPIITWKQPLLVEKSKSIIQVEPKRFNKKELDYWGKYELGLDDLKDESSIKIHAIKNLYVNKEKIIIEDELVFGYLFDNQYWKIYRPYVDKRRKWITNVPITQMYGLENIQNCSKSLIVKSVKDYKVCKKFLTPCCAGVQNESKVAISDDNIKYLLENSEECFVCFDNEDVGVENCKFYNDRGLKYWNVPKRYYDRYKIKDPSDLVEVYGSKRLIKEFTKKIII